MHRLTLYMNPKSFTVNICCFIAVHSDKMTKKKPKFGVLPVLNMPIRSYEKETKMERPSRVVVTEQVMTKKHVYYKHFSDFCNRITQLKSLTKWNIEKTNDRVVLKQLNPSLLLAEYEIIVDDSLGFTIIILGWLLPEDHFLYTRHLRSVRNITISELINLVKTLTICQGVGDMDALLGEVVHHVVPKVFDPLMSECTSSFQSLDYKRSKYCWILNHSDNHCESCKSINKACLENCQQGGYVRLNCLYLLVMLHANTCACHYLTVILI